MVEAPKDEVAIITEVEPTRRFKRSVTFTFTAEDARSVCWFHEVHDIQVPGLKWGMSSSRMVWYEVSEYEMDASITDEVDPAWVAAEITRRVINIYGETSFSCT
jgi:hypothetical protein